MVYMVRRMRGGRRRRRRRGKSGFNTALDKASLALKIARNVKNLINVEFKVWERDLGVSTITESGTTLGLTMIAEGDAFNERNGRSIRGKSWNCNGIVQHNSNGQDTQFLRFMVVQDKHSNGTVPVTAGSGDGVLAVANVLSFLETDNMDRMKILYNKTFTVRKDDREGINFKIHKRLNHKIEYILGTGTSDAMSSGNLYVMCLSSEVTNGPSLQFISRFRFIDN